MPAPKRQRLHRAFPVTLAALACVCACDTKSDDDTKTAAEEDTENTGEEDTGSDDGESSDGESTDPENSGFENTGLCGYIGEAKVSTESYEGTQQYYLVGDSGTGDDLCQIRFDVRSIGAAPPECGECDWTFLVEMSNPVTVLDVDGVCGNSELGMDEAAIETLVGRQMAYGYIQEFTGHENVLMGYNDANGEWEAITFASWDEGTGLLTYDKRDGFCLY